MQTAIIQTVFNSAKRPPKATAIPTLSGVDEQALVRVGEVGVMDALLHAYQSPWLAFLNPLIGVAGIVLGARLKQRARQKTKPVPLDSCINCSIVAMRAAA